MSSLSMPPKLPPKKAALKEQVKVIFPYKAVHEDELSLNDGDTITILSKDIEDQGWWKGELNGKVGVFPENYVIPIRPGQTNNTSSISSNVSPNVEANSLTEESNIMPSKKSPPDSKSNKVTSIINSIDVKTSSRAVDEEGSNANVNGINSGADTATTQQTNFFLNRRTKPFASKPLSKSESAHHLNYNSKDDKDHRTYDSTTENNASSTFTNASSTNSLNHIHNLHDVHQSVKLTHLTASRVRGPRDRRPPSMIQLSRDGDEEDGGSNNQGMLLTSNLSASSDKLDHSRSNLDSSDASATNGTFNSSGNGGRLHLRSDSISEHGAKTSSPVSVPPWMVELKKTQEKKNEIRKKSFNTSDDASSVGGHGGSGVPNTNSLPNRSTTATTTPSSPTKLTASYRMSGDFCPSRFGAKAATESSTPSSSLSGHNSVNNGNISGAGPAFLQARAPSTDSLETKETNLSNGGHTSTTQSTNDRIPPPIAGNKPVKAVKPSATKLIQSSATVASNSNNALTALNNGTTIASANHHSHPNQSVISGKELAELQKELKSIKEKFVSRKEYEDLLKKVNELESQKHSYRTLIKDIINDLAEEKKKVANLHIEVDRLRKITSTV